MTELSIKVLPKPVKELTVQLDLPQKEALHKLNTWCGQPIPISASLWHDDQLFIRLLGATSEFEFAQETILIAPLDVVRSLALWHIVLVQVHDWILLTHATSAHTLSRLSI